MHTGSKFLVGYTDTFYWLFVLFCGFICFIGTFYCSLLDQFLLLQLH